MNISSYHNKYIRYKLKIDYSKQQTIWFFGDTPYNFDISNKITNALNGIMDKLNSYNSDKNIFDLLYYANGYTAVHTLNLKKREVIDMSTLKKYNLHKLSVLP